MFPKRCHGLRFGLLLCLILASLPAYSAEPYRFELQGGFSSVGVDSDFNLYSDSALDAQDSGYVSFLSSRTAGNASSDRLEFAGEYFFDEVEASSGPLKEAAFLERASALTFSIADARGDSMSQTTRNLDGSVIDSTFLTDSETSEYRLRYRFVAPEKPWIGIVSYGYADGATGTRSGCLESDEKCTSYSIGMGGYVGSRTAVIAEYGRSRLDPSSRLAVEGLSLPPSSIRYETLTVGVQSLLELGTRRHLGLAAALHETAATGPAYVADDPVDSYELGVTYYPRNDISIALSTTGEYGTEAYRGDRRGYMLEANWFVTDSIAVGLGYETTDYRNGAAAPGFSWASESNSDGFRFNFSWRH